MEKQVIKDFYGRILGTVEIDSKGNKIIKDFYGKILGKYNKERDRTYDFYGKILSKGDISSALIWQNKNNQ